MCTCGQKISVEWTFRLHQNPNFWTEVRLNEKSHLFYNVATTFGLTDMRDSKGSPLYLYGVDVDTKEAHVALKDLIETLKGITFVVKSHKEYGYHFYILTPIFHEAWDVPVLNWVPRLRSKLIYHLE